MCDKCAFDMAFYADSIPFCSHSNNEWCIHRIHHTPYTMLHNIVAIYATFNKQMENTQSMHTHSHCQKGAQKKIKIINYI